MVLTALTLLAHSGPSEFYNYLRRPDASFRYVVDADKSRIRLTSLTWQGMEWNHDLYYSSQPSTSTKGTCILFVTGGHGDRKWVDLIAGQSHMPTAVLFDIPNQPLYGGLTEDRLIAYTFQKYLDTGDATWPLLFPMTKSVLRAMDAIEATTRNSANPIHRFIISGASKRGWTTWLTGASGDSRVIGIAPMVIDNLNINAQMRQQIAEWGKYSEQIEAYSTTGLLDRLAVGQGKHLAEMVDPYTYRSAIKVPTLIVKGANDPYWTVDALDRYWSQLRMPKWVVTVPNVGHNLGGGAEALETLGAFSRAVAGQAALPKEAWRITRSGNRCTVSLKTSGVPIKGLKVWMAQASNLDFRPSKFVPIEPPVPAGRDASVTFELPDANVALFGEATYETEGGTYRLCSPTKLLRRP